MPRATLAQVEGVPLGILDPLLTSTGITFAYVDATLDREFRVPSGEIRIQSSAMLARHNATIDSNQGYAECEVRVGIHYNAPSAATIQTWLQTHMSALLGGSGSENFDGGVLHRSSWLTSGVIHDVTGGPEASYPERIGNIIVTEVVAIVLPSLGVVS